jgi:hypothetical protein
VEASPLSPAPADGRPTSVSRALNLAARRSTHPRAGPFTALPYGLEQLPYPDNLDNHFAVDPTRWDFYSMDCFRILGVAGDTASTENKLAESYAHEVIRIGTDATGTELSPFATPKPASCHRPRWRPRYVRNRRSSRS